MTKKSILGRIIPFVIGIIILTFAYIYSKNLNFREDFFKFLWSSLVLLYILIFAPIFISAFIPKDLRKGRFLGMILFVSIFSLILATITLNIIKYFNILNETILIYISFAIIFIYAVNITFIFLSTTHPQKPKIKAVKTNNLSWINNAQAQLENLLKKSECLTSQYDNLKPRILACYNEVQNLTPIKNATALKFEHQILDSVVELISAIDQVLAGNSVNLESKTASLENHIRQRQNLTMY